MSVAAAEESDVPAEPKIVVELGGGQVRIQTQGLELSAETMERLQTELLVDEALSSVVMNEESTQVTLVGGDIQKLKAILTHQAFQTAGKIQSLVAAQLGHGQLVPPSPQMVDRDLYIHENVTIAPAEAREELVVIGGDVFVQGTVEELVVLGGNVHVFEGGRILGEVVVLGGQLSVAPGGQVPLQQTVLSSWDIGPWLKRSLWDWWGSGWSLLLSTLFGWLWSWLVVYTLELKSKKFLPAAQAYWAQHKLAALAWGLALSFALLPAVLLLAVSVVGILLLPALLTLIFIWFGVAYALLLKFISDAIRIAKGWPLPGRLLLAQMIWLGLGFIPFAGSLVRFGLWLTVMGVVASALTPLRLTPTAVKSTN
ncbi:MAG: hypothetical protein AB7N80_02670 [Bdellovibrionales bacterium]